MYARVTRPKLSLNTASTVTGGPSLKSPSAARSIPCTPLSPVALSPTGQNTPRNGGLSSFQQQSFPYTNSCSASKSILKKTHSSPRGGNSGSKRIQFKGEPIVHPITPIENTDDYYGSYVKMSKDERRWSRLSER